ncbi:MAG TPA: DNA gyrase subunit A [Nitrosarchaeum sp.]|nr:DNA gyrase subunit A [Nitrosarchaeum sp.]
MSRTGIKLHPLEHCRIRPAAYIGNVDTVTANIYIYDTETSKFKKEEILWNQGLFNIIREIGSNCIDNKWRSEEYEDSPKMTKIKMDVNMEDNSITFWNNGYCIPISLEEYQVKDFRKGKDTVEEMYPAEMFFSEMLSGTNFEKTQNRKSSGMYGMGAKATNALSDLFEVEHTNPENKKKFTQTFTEGAQKRTEPEIEKYTKKLGYTQIKFVPSYDIFKFSSETELGLTEDFVNALKAYAYEISLVTSLPVIFNEEKVYVTSLQQYAKMYFESGHKTMFFKEEGKTGKVVYNESECVLLEMDNENIDDRRTEIEHVTFVNGIKPKNGGTHVDAWKQAIFSPLVKLFNQKFAKSEIKASTKDFMPYFMIFVKCEVNEWKWDGGGQSKDKFTHPFKVGQISEDICKKILKWSFVEDLFKKLTATKELKVSRKDAKRKKMVYGSKAIDANEAGGKKSSKCTLMIVEGQSAKALAIDLINHLPGGNNFNGVFAIKGKFVNAENEKKTLNNEEAIMLQHILGLVPKVDYMVEANKKRIRYGNINFLTDQDEDGFHIRGLLSNFFFKEYRDIWENRIINFYTENTPIILAYYKKCIQPFFSNLSYKIWLEEGIKHTMEYHKGLGTWSRKDAKYLAENRKTANFVLEGDENEYMNMAFGKGKSGKRKEWITNGMNKDEDGSVIDVQDITEVKEVKIDGDVSFSEFINTQLLQFGLLSLSRAIPSLIDGFKEGQRKIYYAFVKENITRPITVEAASGSVTKIAGYHHGAASLQGGIAKMGRDFVGVNNVPVILTKGQCGSRLGGGKDLAQPRYMHACLNSFSKTIFHPDDNDILEYVKDDGKYVEPKYYLPVVPMVLINGAKGVAVGFSTEIPPHNPTEVCDWIVRWLDDEEDLPDLNPWWRGFKGEVIVEEKVVGGNTIKKVRTKGIITKVKENTYRVTELPIKVWTEDFKELLEQLQIERKKGKEKLPPIVSKFSFNSKDTNDVDITFTTKDHEVDIDDKADPFHILVKDTISTSNMFVLDEHGYPTTFFLCKDMLTKFCEFRLPFYQKRKDYLLKVNRLNLKILKNKLKFVKAITIDKTLNLGRTNEKNEKKMIELDIEKIDDSFDYLFNMHIKSITLEKIEELTKEIASLRKYIISLKNKHIKDMWKTDINSFLEAWDEYISE